MCVKEIKKNVHTYCISIKIKSTTQILVFISFIIIQLFLSIKIIEEHVTCNNTVLMTLFLSQVGSYKNYNTKYCTNKTTNLLFLL